MATLRRWRVTHTGTAFNGGGISTFYQNVATAGTLSASSTALQTFWNDVKSQVITGTTSAFDGVVEEIDDSDGSLIALQSAPTFSVAGTATGDLLPFATQAMIRWKTSLVVPASGPGTKSHLLAGRTFIGGQVESSSTSGSGPTSGSLAGYNAAAATFVASVFTPNIWSRSGGTSGAVTVGTCSPTWAVLRSRRD